MKNKILTIIFIIYISLFSILSILIPDKSISNSERRKFNTFPSFELDSKWINDLDKYFLDHFILRDEFRSLKAMYNYNFLNKKDNNKIYLKDNYIFKSNYPTNIDSINNFKNKINKLSNLLSDDNNIYMLIIPDKNYYLNTDDFLHIDYDYIYEDIKGLGYKNIDVRNILNLNDYYETDTHWRQENLDKVVKEISDVMNFNYIDINYTKNKFNDFYGVYYGESAINRKPESLVYLTNELFNNVEVKYLENKNINTVYNKSKLKGIDAYDVYLDGASSFIEIFNNNIENGKELVIFRDSFGSSLTPLLIPYYKKITVIDNRYIKSEIFKDKLKFSNQDVLFLYSTLLVNDSGSLKG